MVSVLRKTLLSVFSQLCWQFKKIHGFSDNCVNTHDHEHMLRKPMYKAFNQRCSITGMKDQEEISRILNDQQRKMVRP